ncbi:nadh-dependent oxidoreductase [Liquorilactobacillus capillatus DSM 19910]|uniref:Nadh-dependent oxidoreductase n=2 Tax=Liquorilactobacillus capillatus TaxID=480931 RepID=A0A0R1M3D0_9LACO|nr:nadh-dependent oxidoreductase [Liquorilactobacillus capillatus DSM 19910]
MIITEATYVDEAGIAFKGEIGASTDKYIPGLTKLANTIKDHGAKAILQLHHGGRQAAIYYDRGGIPIVPSKRDYSFIDYPVREITTEEILRVIKEFGAATIRAIKAGFDGVEIHGANHYLLQQFFSAYSNQRTDWYGGSPVKRMNFILDIVNEVSKVVKEFGNKNFIIGIRISQQEIHGPNFGFGWKENSELIKRLNKTDLDYIHISAMGNAIDGWKATPSDKAENFTELYAKVIDPNIKLIACGNILTVKDANEAIQVADLAAIAREALMEPEFTKKLIENKEDDIVSKISPERLNHLQWPSGLFDVIIQGEGWQGNIPKHGYVTDVPMPGDESVIQYQRH